MKNIKALSAVQRALWEAGECMGTSICKRGKFCNGLMEGNMEPVSTKGTPNIMCSEFILPRISEMHTIYLSIRCVVDTQYRLVSRI